MCKYFTSLFKPKKIVLANGHSVFKPISKVPLVIVLLVIGIYLAILATGFNVATIIKRYHELGVILGKIFRPDFSYFGEIVKPLIDTIQMSLLGTFVGCFLALPVAIIASGNINKNRFWLILMRFLLAIVRTLPTIIIATFFALVFGLGTFAGTVAITLFTFGIVGKMLFESIETIDMGPFEAMEAFGANKYQAFMAAVAPQILPTYLSHCLYCFEMNIRAASILGYVGAGGLGLLINEQIGWREYHRLGMVLLVLFITVVIVDNLSNYLRRKLG